MRVGVPLQLKKIAGRIATEFPAEHDYEGMKILTLQNGKKMPQLGLGTWKATEPDAVYHAVSHAIASGYRHIDCAHIYGNEAEIGRALRDAISSGKVTREELWITSKLWNDAHAPLEVRPALDLTLSNLGLDYLDLYLIHWPVSLRKGANFPLSSDDLVPRSAIPLTETWSEMEDAVDEGLIGSIGVSNFGPMNLSELLEACDIAPVINQVEMHPYWPQSELLAFCSARGIALTAYSPLGSIDRSPGMKAPDEPVLLQDPTVIEIADAHGATPAQILISWGLHKGVSVIPKSVTPARIEENFAAQDLVLSTEDLKRLDAIGRTFRYVDGSFWVVDGGPYALEDVWR